MRVIEVRELGKKYMVSHEKRALVRYILPSVLKIKNYEELWALKNINFTLRQGQCLGITGGNGAGKTTLLNLLAGITVPTEGSIKTRGKLAALLSLGAGFHPELTGEVIDTLRDLAKEGVTMLIVSHEMPFAREVADEMLFYDEGAIVETGTPEQFFKNPQSERARKFMARLLKKTQRDKNV